MDYSKPLGMEYRVVDEGEHLGRPVRIVSGARTYDASLGELWDAITDPERIPRWFAPVTGELRLGGRFQIEGNAGGEITRCEEPTALDLTWEFAGNTSWVTVRLEPAGGGARLTLSHLTGKDEASEAHWRKYGPGATGVGWELGFLGLGLHLASGGEAVDPEENGEWLASADGAAFLGNSARAWGEAHVRAGEAPETAVAMGENTATFYTGG